MSFDQTTSGNSVENPTLSLLQQLKNITDDISTAGRTESEKETDRSSLIKNRRSEDGRHIKSSTLNEKQLMPIKRMNNSLKDANIELATKTPIIHKNPKFESINPLSHKSRGNTFHDSMKHKKGVLMMKNQASRNYSLYSPVEDKSPGTKHSDNLADKFMKRSNEFKRKNNNKPDFATLSFNAKRGEHNRDLKESVSNKGLIVLVALIVKYCKSNQKHIHYE